MTTVVQIPEAFDLTKYKRGYGDLFEGRNDEIFEAEDQLNAFCKRLEAPQLEDVDGTFVRVHARIDGNPSPNQGGELEFTIYGPTWVRKEDTKSSRCVDVNKKLGRWYDRLLKNSGFGFHNVITAYGAVASDAQGKFLDVYAIDPHVPIRDYKIHRIYSPKVVLALELHQ